MDIGEPFSPEDGETADKKMALLQNQAEFLMKSFDVVMIFAQKFNPKTNDTLSFNTGRGSWTARRGQIFEWVLTEDEAIREKARQSVR